MFVVNTFLDLLFGSDIFHGEKPTGEADAPEPPSQHLLASDESPPPASRSASLSFSTPTPHPPQLDTPTSRTSPPRRFSPGARQSLPTATPVDYYAYVSSAIGAVFRPFSNCHGESEPVAVSAMSRPTTPRRSRASSAGNEGPMQREPQSPSMRKRDATPSNKHKAS